MSKYISERIPKHVRDILKTYVIASEKLNGFADPYIKQKLIKDSQNFKYIHASKLLRKNRFRDADFKPVMREILHPLFERPLRLGKLEGLETSELFKTSVKPDESILISDYSKRMKNYTDYEAHIYQSFASYYAPYKHIGPFPMHTKSFKWYTRLLNDTPFIFILKQNNRLFSESSLNQMNFPIHKLETNINKITKSWDNVEDDRTLRNYHLTSLLTTDIFSLALKTCHLIKKETEFDRFLEEINWEKYSYTDPLEQVLNQKKHIDIVNRDSHSPVSVTEIEQFFSEHNTREILKELEYQDIESFFPYDITYNDYFILTIEEPVINEDHSQIFKILEKSGLDILGARVSLQQSAVNDYFSKNSDNPRESASPNSNYEHMLDLAKKHREESVKGIEAVMKKLGELNLIEIKEHTYNSCIYLFPPDQ